MSGITGDNLAQTPRPSHNTVGPGFSRDIKPPRLRRFLAAAGRSEAQAQRLNRLPSRSHLRYAPTMGLDAVEIVLRTEELFAIHIEDDEAAAASTVGDLYRLVCTKLHLEPLSSPTTSDRLPVITHKKKKFSFLQTQTPLPAPPEVLPWSPQRVWDALVAIFDDQMLLEPDEIRYHARIGEDLGICGHRQGRVAPSMDAPSREPRIEDASALPWAKSEGPERSRSD
jgi:hypothetical protein